MKGTETGSERFSNARNCFSLLRSGGQESRLNSIRMYTMLACASRSVIFDNSAVPAPRHVVFGEVAAARLKVS